MKKNIAIIFTLCMILCAFHVHAKGAENKFQYHSGRIGSSATVLNTGAVLSRPAVVSCNSLNVQNEGETLLERFRQGTENLSGEIIIDDFYLSRDDLFDIYETLVFCSPCSYYLICSNGTYRFGYRYVEDNTDLIYSIVPVYDLDIYKNTNVESWRLEIDENKLNDVIDEVRAKQDCFKNAVAEIESNITPDMTDEEILYTYHNYISTNYSYASDQEGNPNTNVNNIMYMLSNKKTVCQTFAILYNYMMMEHNYETAFVSCYYADGNINSYKYQYVDIDGEQVKIPYHTWNLVKLNGYWYHIDITWDDFNGRTSKAADDGDDNIISGIILKYFLASDMEFQDSHNVPIDDYTCAVYELDESLYPSDTRYDNLSWRNTSSNIVQHGDYFYYILENDKTSLYRCKIYDSNEECVVDDLHAVLGDDFIWRFVDEDNVRQKYDTFFSSLAIINGNIYLNGAKSIHRFSIDDMDITEATPITLPGDNYNIYSMTVSGSTLYYYIADKGDFINAKPGGFYDTEYNDQSYRNDVTVDQTDEGLKLSSPLDRSIFAVIKYQEPDGNLQIKADSFTLYGNEATAIKDIPKNAKVFIWNYNMQPFCEKITVE